VVEFNEGKLISDNIELRIFDTLEHGRLDKVTSIILHRTAAPTAISTLRAYGNGLRSGAHFLIGEDGKAYQTARVNQVCWHAGILLPRCKAEKSCDPNELKTITALLHEDGLSFGRRVRNVSRHEAKKDYPLRYPSNKDSIGIEVVGRFMPEEGSFEDPSKEQLKSLKWLVKVLVDEYSLSINDNVYAHGAIARKEKTEGKKILHYLFYGAAQ